jgi:hypothetical protein
MNDLIWYLTEAEWWGADSGLEFAYSNGRGRFYGDGKGYGFSDGDMYGDSSGIDAENGDDGDDGDDVFGGGYLI